MIETQEIPKILDLESGQTDRCRVDACDGWTRVRKTVSEAVPNPWDLATLSSSLPHSARLALVPGVPELMVCSDVRVDGADDSSARLADAALHVTEAAKLVRSFRGPVAYPAPDYACLPDAGELAQLCEEAGWPVSRHQDGMLVVDLEVRGGYYASMVRKHPSGLVKASVRVAELRDVPESARPAIGIALLLVAGAVRAVRAAVYDDGIVFETTLDPADAGDIGHALSALSVACGLSCRELALLRDDAVAQLYLRTAGRLHHLQTARPSQGQEGRETDVVNG